MFSIHFAIVRSSFIVKFEHYTDVITEIRWSSSIKNNLPKIDLFYDWEMNERDNELSLKNELVLHWILNKGLWKLETHLIIISIDFNSNLFNFTIEMKLAFIILSPQVNVITIQLLLVLIDNLFWYRFSNFPIFYRYVPTNSLPPLQLKICCGSNQ